jgi:ASC-1-like (ASCH) protein
VVIFLGLTVGATATAEAFLNFKDPHGTIGTLEPPKQISGQQIKDYEEFLTWVKETKPHYWYALGMSFESGVVPQKLREYRKWLKKHKIPFDKVIANASNKGQICKENNIEAFLDDNVKNCESTSGAGVKTFMMYSALTEGYNNPLVKRIYSFVEFYREIIKLAEQEEISKTYVVNVGIKPYKKIKNGKKTVDLRLNDLRRNNIKVGDKIVFRLNNSTKQLVAKVLDAKKFNDFPDLINYYGREKCGFLKKTVEQASVIMRKFYKDEEIKKLGVIGFEFELINE